jgi:hypothetical protein
MRPDAGGAATRPHPAVIPGYQLNKRHWNTMIIDGSLPDAMIADMVGKRASLHPRESALLPATSGAEPPVRREPSPSP